VSKTVLIATEKPFSSDARDEVIKALESAGYQARVLEKYEAKTALLDAVKSADALIIRSDIVDAEVLDKAPNLRLVVRAGAGYDNVDCDAAKKRGIAVMNTPGQNANAVAELALAMMVYMARGQFDGGTGNELMGKSLGIHAFGAVGRAVARIAKGFSMKVRAFDPYVDAAFIKDAGVEPVASVEELYKTSHYVSLHIPATDKTKNSIGQGLLGLMPKGATLINTARKEVINEGELLRLFAERGDFKYATDIAPSAAVHDELRAKHGNRSYATPKKMGAQTNEANSNAGVAAANQIVDFFEKNDKRFVVNGV
jgi:D-3-phosphoglycerate dehydrogenase